MPLSPELDRLRVELLAATQRDLLERALVRSAAAATWRPARVPRRVLVLAVIAVLLFAAVAIAGGPKSLLELIARSDGPAKHIDQLTSPGEPVTRAEYDELVESLRVPAADAGAHPQLRAIYRFAPLAASRVIVDDPRVGRVIAVPLADGSGFCKSFRPPVGDVLSADCPDRFDSPGGLNVTSIAYVPRGSHRMHTAVYGFAADDVTAVVVELGDGSTHDVTLVENVFFWDGAGSPPARMRSVRAEVTHTLDVVGNPVQ